MDDTFVPLVGHPLFWLALVALCAPVAYLLVRHKRMERAADRLIDEQYFVMDDVEISDVRGQVRPAQQTRFDELIARIKGQADGAVRHGHIYWVLHVLDGLLDDAKVPRLAPPGDKPYCIEHDIGVPALRRFMVAKADGNLVEAFDWLRRAAEKGSPIAMACYGAALVKGEVPGAEADPRAAHWLERASDMTKGAKGAAELGFFLLEGEFMPRDMERGLRLLERAYADGDDCIGVWDLVAVYREGRHGVPADKAAALKWALLVAPSWRRWLARLGVDQSAWMDGRIATLERAKKLISDQSPWDRTKAHHELVSELRSRFAGKL